ncbi:hypothetical protein ACFXAE_23730 [Streptomyces sp. NPDC059454]
MRVVEPLGELLPGEQGAFPERLQGRIDTALAAAALRKLCGDQVVVMGL